MINKGVYYGGWPVFRASDLLAAGGHQFGMAGEQAG
jgi:hypothetical protein